MLIGHHKSAAIRLPQIINVWGASPIGQYWSSWVWKDPVRGTKVAVANYRTGGWQEDVRYSSDLWSWARTSDGGADMKMVTIVVALYLGTCSLACAQSSAGSAAGSSGAGGAAGSTLSNGSTISGTGGSPGPNTSKALNRGMTGNNLGAPPNRPSAGPAATHGNAVDTPAAKAATQNLGNTDAGVLKK